MTEKIKICVPADVGALLRKDAEDFRIVKPSGEANLNAFLNTLIVHFYESFAADDDKLREGIREALFGVPAAYQQDVMERVLRTVAGRDTDTHRTASTVCIAVKPTRQTENVFLYIENVLLRQESLSSFYRRMLVAYAKKTKNDRERIIHKDCYTQLCLAVEKQVQVCVVLEGGQVYPEASVFAVAAAKDELFNYALLYSDKKNRTVRLAKLRSVSLLTKPACIPEENARLFERQIASGVQYPMYATDCVPIRVRLSDKGKALFGKIYLYRPTPTAIDGDVYTFECSANQILYYFERFGREALILSPKKLGIFMRNYYYYALKEYRTLYGKDT